MSGHTNVIECVSFAFNSAVDFLGESIRKEEDEKVNNARSVEFLASGSRDKTIRIWDCLRGTCLMILRGHDNWVRKIAFSPVGKYLYSCSDDKSIRFWDLSANGRARNVANAHAHFVVCLAVNPRYPMLATGSVDKTVKVWECR